MLFRSIIYVENIENLTYIASPKKRQNTYTLKKKKKTADHIVSRGQKYFAHTGTHWHTHTHTKENNEKLVLICLPLLYPQPSGPKLWTFPAGCLGDGW